MKVNLAKTLINKGIIRPRTRITAKCPVYAMGEMPADISLTLSVDRIAIDNDSVRFYATHNSGKRFAVGCEQVKVVDGMEPERLAAAYDIDRNGQIRLPGKKRGRKPKINILEESNG